MRLRWPGQVSSQRRSASAISRWPSPVPRCDASTTTRPIDGGSNFTPGSHTRTYASSRPSAPRPSRCHDWRSRPSGSRYAQSCSSTKMRARSASMSYTSSPLRPSKRVHCQVSIALSSGKLVSDQFYQLLALVPALEQPEEGLGRVLQALRHRFLVLELAGGHQRAELLERLGPGVHVLADDEALD